ncbi:MAG: YggS family pyridoxal phosphate-dependent enzyme [Peptococcaceae bacterium]|nr:YggS family pyridoxal phosphate-dependent enzyme [Peptococcaceae bacterium]
MNLLQIKNNVQILHEGVNKAAIASGYNPKQIKIIAVTKKVEIEGINQAVQEGMTELGENRVQEMLAKQPFVDSKVNWHLIGHLQMNKVKSVIGKVKMIHSLDSWRLACEISKYSLEQNLVSDVLVQVNVSGESSKYGLPVSDVIDFLKTSRELKGLSVRGLMTIAPLVENSEETRPFFKELRNIRDISQSKLPDLSLDFLSMGMTNDYQVAIEEGSNIIRIGSAIFGSRAV